MFQDNFSQLVQAFCQMAGIDQPGLLMDGGTLSIDGVLCSLLYDPVQNPELVYIYGNTGIDAKTLSSASHRALLAANLEVYLEYGTCLAISPSDGRLIYCLSLSLEALTAEELEKHLKTVSHVVFAFQEQFQSEPVQYAPARTVHSSPAQPQVPVG